MFMFFGVLVPRSRTTEIFEMHLVSTAYIDSYKGGQLKGFCTCNLKLYRSIELRSWDFDVGHGKGDIT